VRLLLPSVVLLLVALPSLADPGRIDAAEPAPGTYSLAPAPQEFEVEIDCDGLGDQQVQVFLDYVLLVDEQEDLLGPDQHDIGFWTAGTYVLQGRCIGEDGSIGQPNDATWTVHVAQPASRLSRPDCQPKTDPTPATASDATTQWMVQQLLKQPNLWHRSGPAACQLADDLAALEQASLALPGLTALRDKLEDGSGFSRSTWERVVELVPPLPARWSSLHDVQGEAADARATAASLKVFDEVRAAAVAFLQAGSAAAGTEFVEELRALQADYQALAKDTAQAADDLYDASAALSKAAAGLEDAVFLDDGWYDSEKELLLSAALQMQKSAVAYAEAAGQLESWSNALEGDLDAVASLLDPPESVETPSEDAQVTQETLLDYPKARDEPSTADEEQVPEFSAKLAIMVGLSLTLALAALAVALRR
jgi:hypothetical protein